MQRKVGIILLSSYVYGISSGEKTTSSVGFAESAVESLRPHHHEFVTTNQDVDGKHL